MTEVAPEKARDYEFLFLDGRGGEVVELIDIYGNDRIGFEAGESLLVAYDGEDKSLREIPSRLPRPGWQEFQPVPGGLTYAFAPRRGAGGSTAGPPSR